MFTKESTKRLLIFFISYTIIFFVFFKTLKLTLPFLIAGGTVLLLKKPTKWLVDHFKIKSSIASILTITIFYTITIGVFSLFVIGVIYEVRNLTVTIDFSTWSQWLTELTNKGLSFYKGLDPGIINFVEQNIANFGESLSSAGVNLVKPLFENSLSFFKNVPYVFMMIAFAVLSTFFILNDCVQGKYTYQEFQEGPIYAFIIKAKNTIFKYCFSYLLVIFITFLQVLILFAICHIPNMLVLSILCALLDLLPIVGMALIILPLAVSAYFTGNTFIAIVLVAGYLIICLLRQIIEPRILSTTMQIHPLSSIVAIFVGLTAGGFIGMLYCIFIVLFFKIAKDMIFVKE